MRKVLLVYASMSGNTEEVAEIITEELEKQSIKVDIIFLDVANNVIISKPSVDYDALFIGTYTWDLGYAPEEISDFVELSHIDVPVYSFGTGETQFGDELFCVASDKLARYYNSSAPVLKIEQSPRGAQEKRVIKWVKEILNKKH